MTCRPLYARPKGRDKTLFLFTFQSRSLLLRASRIRVEHRTGIAICLPICEGLIVCALPFEFIVPAERIVVPIVVESVGARAKIYLLVGGSRQYISFKLYIRQIS